MTIYVGHAAADLEAATSLETFLERRGQFVELDDGSTALPPVQPVDVVLMLHSKDFLSSSTRLRLEQRALDAWAQRRLVIVRLDKSEPPVGLRDLPFIDGGKADERDAKWHDVANAVRDALARTSSQVAQTSSTDAPSAKPKAKRLGIVRTLALLVLALPGLGALAASCAIWLVNRIGPTPGSFEDLRRGIDQFGMRYGAPSGLTEWAFLFSILLTAAIFLFFITRLFRTRKKRPAVPAPAHSWATGAAILVSCAKGDEKTARSLMQAIAGKGPVFVIERKTAADEIVREISSAFAIAVICSNAGFASDRVKRDVHLADRLGKKLALVFIEPVTAPADFEYYFTGASRLKLYETPPAYRADALLGALGAAA